MNSWKYQDTYLELSLKTAAEYPGFLFAAHKRFYIFSIAPWRNGIKRFVTTHAKNQRNSQSIKQTFSSNFEGQCDDMAESNIL